MQLKFCTKVFENFQRLYEGKTISDMKLEEVELSEDSKYWSITLGYSTQTLSGDMIPFPTAREYKIFKVKSDTGEIKSMKIRQLH